MTARQTRAEVLKLARLLDTDPAKLAFLERVDAESVRELREQATERLFAADRRRLERVAAASGKLPAPIVATIGQHVFGPLLCARVACLLDPREAIDLGRRLPPGFLAEIAIHCDPRRVSEIVAGMPTGRIVAVATELAERGEHVAMGRFVGYTREDALAACIDALDDETLLRTAFVIEGDGALEHVVAMLPEGRVAGVLAASEDDDLAEVREVIAAARVGGRPAA